MLKHSSKWGFSIQEDQQFVMLDNKANKFDKDEFGAVQSVLWILKIF